MKLPKVLVIVVNYNGLDIIKPCLQSLYCQDYNNFKVLVVDNNSKDDSVEMIKNEFPWVIVDIQKENIGFAEGNNIGMRRAIRDNYDYVALLNSDAKASSNWISDLVNKFDSNNRVGVASSKLVLWEKYLPVEIIAEIYSPSELNINHNDTRSLGVRIEMHLNSVGCTYDKTLYGGGWWPPEVDGARWSNLNAICYVPFASDYKADLTICFKAKGLIDGQKFVIKIGDHIVMNSELTKRPRTYIFNVSRELVDQYKLDMINNFGSVVDSKGYGHDVGFGMPDNVNLINYFSEAFCGANALISTKALKETGLFNKKYFMYYEDIDLSIRMRLAGYRICISSDSNVRHYHSASNEFNQKITYYINRNRIWTLLSYGTSRMIFQEFVKVNLLFFINFIRVFIRLITFKAGIRAAFFIFISSGKLLISTWYSLLFLKNDKLNCVD